jgi:CRISPR-associated protein Cas2
MSGRCLYVIAFDVPSDRTRRRVASLLEGCGIRVQRSVFEALLTDGEADGLARRIKAAISPQDDVRMYCVPTASVKKCRTFHNALILGDDAPWVF